MKFLSRTMLAAAMTATLSLPLAQAGQAGITVQGVTAGPGSGPVYRAPAPETTENSLTGTNHTGAEGQ